MVATQIFWIFTPKFGEDEPILTNIFQIGWSHHLGGEFLFFFWVEGMCQKDKDHTVSIQLVGIFATFSRFCFGVRMKCLFSVCFDYPVVNMAQSPKGGKIQGWYKLHGNCANYFYPGVFLGGCFVHMFYFHPDPWGNDPIWRAYFQMAWFNWFNHQLE